MVDINSFIQMAKVWILSNRLELMVLTAITLCSVLIIIISIVLHRTRAKPTNEEIAELKPVDDRKGRLR